MFNHEYRRLSHVERWDTFPRIKRQSVAEHSFYVALYVSQICDLLGVKETQKLRAIDYALRHDASEAVTGDILGPIKKCIVNQGRLEEIESIFADQVHDYSMYRKAGDDHGTYWTRDLIKVADKIDELFYTAEEQALGNRQVHRAYGHIMVGLRKALDFLPDADARKIWGAVMYQLREVLNAGGPLPPDYIPGDENGQ